MGLDDRLPCAQEGCAAVFLAVHLVLQVCHAALEQQVSQLAAEVCEEHLLQHAQQHFCHALGQLEDHIAGEAVAHHHVHFAIGHIAGFNIAYKADAGGGLEQLVCFLEHGGALALLRTVVGERHAGAAAAFHLIHIAAAHHGKSCQHLGAALHISTAVQQQIGLLFSGHHGSQSRTLDALEGAHDQACAHMQRAGAAGRNKGVALAVLQHVQAHHDGGVLLLADGTGRLIAHVDDLGAVHQLDAVQRDAVFLCGLAHQRFVAHADDGDAVLLHGLCGTLQHRQRGVVAAHHVHDNFHSFSPFRWFALSVIASQCHLSQSERLWQSTRSPWFCQGLSLWESWTRSGLRGQARLPFQSSFSSSQCWKLATARWACAM